MTLKSTFLSEKKAINELKEEIEKSNKIIKSRHQIVCAVADKTQEEVK